VYKLLYVLGTKMVLGLACVPLTVIVRPTERHRGAAIVAKDSVAPAAMVMALLVGPKEPSTVSLVSG
jgi:hypothetical protein